MTAFLRHQTLVADHGSPYRLFIVSSVIFYLDECGVILTEKRDTDRNKHEEATEQCTCALGLKMYDVRMASKI